MEEEKKPVGRPSLYSQELADKICAELAEGVSLRGVCMKDDMPSLPTIFSWMRTNEEFLKQYARAKQESADAMAEEIIDITDDALEDAKNGSEHKGINAVVQAHRLKVDTRKWLMSKMKPKKYGEKVDVTSGGETIKGNTIVFKDFSDGTGGKQ